MVAILDSDIMTPAEIRQAETDEFAAACFEALSAYVAAADARLAQAQRIGAVKAPATVAQLIDEARALLRQPLDLVGC